MEAFEVDIGGEVKKSGIKPHNNQRKQKGILKDMISLSCQSTFSLYYSSHLFWKETYLSLLQDCFQLRFLLVGSCPITV